MTTSLRAGLVIVSLLLFTIIILILRKRKMPVKYSLVWLFSSFLILLISIFPKFFEWISKKIGFMTMSNMVIGIFIFILLMITIILTVIVSGQRRKIVLLMQEVSMNKERINQLTKRK